MNRIKNTELVSIIILLFIMLVLSICVLFIKLKGTTNNKKIITTDTIKYEKINYKYNPRKQYIDYTPSNNKKYDNIIKDKNNIILKKYADKNVYDIETISHYGLFLFSKYIETENYEYYKLSKAQADYVLSKLDNTSGCFYNDYNISLFTNKRINSEYKISVPWCSGSAQALSISLLSRIYSIEKDDTYRNASILAMNPIKNDMSIGGLKTDLFGFTFYDDYNLKKPIYSLNSMMYTTIAFYDLSNIYNLKETEEMFYDCIKTIEFSLSFYNNQSTSIKNLKFIKNNELNVDYDINNHIEHLYQLAVINQINPNEIFDYYLKIWSI